VADLRRDAFDEPPGPADDPNGPWAWPVYDGHPETVSDPPRPVPAARRGRRWAWPAAAAATAVVVLAGVGLRLAPAPQEPEPGQPLAVAPPAQWGRVDPALTRGLVVVVGGAEADGLVVTGDGLVATSYTRIMGDRHPPADGFALRVAADGHDALPATILGTDEAADIAILQVPGFRPASVVSPGGPVRVGETLTLLDDQGGRQPVVGVGVVVTETGRTCSRAGSPARPEGFRFSLAVASAEPGAALVRADGTLVGMYYGGDDASHHCAVPVADLLRVVETSGR
jgi:hypothetical protein